MCRQAFNTRQSVLNFSHMVCLRVQWDLVWPNRSLFSTQPVCWQMTPRIPSSHTNPSAQVYFSRGGRVERAQGELVTVGQKQHKHKHKTQTQTQVHKCTFQEVARCPRNFRRAWFLKKKWWYIPYHITLHQIVLLLSRPSQFEVMDKYILLQHFKLRTDVVPWIGMGWNEWISGRAWGIEQLIKATGSDTTVNISAGLKYRKEFLGEIIHSSL